HGHVTDAGQSSAHRLTLATASSPSCRNSLLSHKSVPKSVLAPFATRPLKWAYSASQVGSSCTSVTVSCGGRPEGSTRVRTVKLVGPHLHSEAMCALPCSANRSQVK